NLDMTVDVIFLTAANDYPSIQRALHYGAADYLIKPFNFERFKKALLKYRQKSDLINGGKGGRQEELDVFLLNNHPQDVNPLDLPKGLTSLTLGRIARQIINWEQDAFSAAEIADLTGI